MPVMSCSNKNTKAHFEKHVIITTIIIVRYLLRIIFATTVRD